MRSFTERLADGNRLDALRILRGFIFTILFQKKQLKCFWTFDIIYFVAGYGVAWYRARLGAVRSQVQILLPRLKF